ncbi:(2Fe-2S)-binding protein [Thiomicrorhabdus heinhorstiae]|uniref:(2Fe-2S)-binding protein n=1 Tax=Thiomicrorhabdus heinhorstiae TaxID=2748010 RepID=A0ABS0BW85_9GAMM|nr:(2Fe-2S)-binding protein [Thiomicrorhabdus heinhorstiae]MBF6057320.1 (2Fe-2S)-binding protein [Thiomicrorhabdus heinhorstiae]
MNLHLCQETYVQMLIEENPLICTCHHVYLDQLLKSLPQNPQQVGVETLQLATGASTGCGGCLSKLQGITECYRLKPGIFQQP